MFLPRRLTCLLMLPALSIFSSQSFANGLDDLNKALNKFTGRSVISATLESSYVNNRGSDEDIKTTTGIAHVQLLDNANGLRISYSNYTLMLLEQEANQQEEDEEAKTPTLNVINNFKATELRSMLSAAAGLKRALVKAQFVSEESTLYHGHQARLLRFELPLNAVINDKEVRSYFSDFEGTLNVIIDSNGVPLQSKLSFEGSGSIFVFFSLSMSESKTYLYRVIDDRLVNYHREYQRQQESTLDQSNSSGYQKLTVFEQSPLS